MNGNELVALSEVNEQSVPRTCFGFRDRVLAPLPVARRSGWGPCREQTFAQAHADIIQNFEHRYVLVSIHDTAGEREAGVMSQRLLEDAGIILACVIMVARTCGISIEPMTVCDEE